MSGQPLPVAPNTGVVNQYGVFDTILGVINIFRVNDIPQIIPELVLVGMFNPVDQGNLFINDQKGKIEQEYISAWEARIRAAMSVPRISSFWSNTKSGYRKSFSDYIDSLQVGPV